MEPLLQVADELNTCLSTIMDPSTEPQKRRDATKVCEEFKTNGEHKVAVGFLLLEKAHNAASQHFGLQIVEHSIRYKWQEMGQPEKVQVKNCIDDLLTKGVKIAPGAPSLHVKDGIARILVEMAKREYPQQWPYMWEGLIDFAKNSSLSCEIVLLTLSRICEDVVVYNWVTGPRRRDLYQGLVSSASPLLTFMLDTLDNYLTPSNDQEELVSLCMSCLSALASCLEWMPAEAVFGDSNRVLQTLYSLLSNDRYQLAASEALTSAAQRKGQLKERMGLTVLFSGDALQCVIDATLSVSGSKEKYTCLKSLSRFFCALAAQLCFLMTNGDNLERPEAFPLFLEILISFTGHPSREVQFDCFEVWRRILRHCGLVSDEGLATILPRLLNASHQAILRNGLPSGDGDLSAYAAIDFEDDKEFSAFFNGHRNGVLNTIRLVASIKPDVSFEFICSKMMELLQQNEPSSETLLQWEASTSILESVCKDLSPEFKRNADVHTTALELSRKLLEFDTSNNQLISNIQSCLLALFDLCNNDSTFVKAAVDKVFSTLLKNPNNENRANISLRRNTCTAFFRLCTNHSQDLLPLFDPLHSVLKQLVEENSLSHMERTTLVEGMMLINNHFNDFEKQRSFIEEMLESATSLWMNTEFLDALSNFELFMKYIGISDAPPDTTDNCQTVVNRSKLLLSMYLLSATIKRSTIPDDVEKAKSGGFVVPDSDPIQFQSAAAPYAKNVLELLLKLVRVMHSLWTEPAKRLRHVGWDSAFGLSEQDKLFIVGRRPEAIDGQVQRSPLHSMQYLLQQGHEAAILAVTNCVSCLAQQVYVAPSIDSLLHETMFISFKEIPLYWIRPTLKLFLRRYIQRCPDDSLNNAVNRLLSSLLTDMSEILPPKWKEIQQRGIVDEDGDTEEDKICDEMVNDHLIRIVSKQLLDVVETAILGKYLARLDPDVNDHEMEMTTEADPEVKRKTEPAISERGKILLEEQSVWQPVTLLLITGASWPDSAVARKCLSLSQPLIKYFAQRGNLSCDHWRHMLESVLQCFVTNGHMDAVFTEAIILLSRISEILAEHHKDVLELLRRLPGSDDAVVNQLLTASMPEKKRKELLRKAVKDIVGKSLGEQYRLAAPLPELPPMLRQRKRPVAAADDGALADIAALFGSA